MSNRKYRPGGAQTAHSNEVPEALLGQGLHDVEPPALDVDDPMPDHLARKLMANAAVLMNHIMNLCGHAMDAIPGGVADAKFGQEVAREAEMIQRDDGKRIKRARPHALSNLMRIAVSAGRLMKALLQATNPGMFPEKVTLREAKESLQKAHELYDELKSAHAT